MDKNSELADAVGNLYRAALYLARKDLDKTVGREFVQKAINKLKESQQFYNDAQGIEEAVKKYHKENIILAEKILDKYHRLRIQISNDKC
jgi:nitrate/TMAO reductase-like tetraheme cytochrome c subunit